jgi:uncharacterized membrane protein
MAEEGVEAHQEQEGQKEGGETKNHRQIRRTILHLAFAIAFALLFTVVFRPPVIALVFLMIGALIPDMDEALGWGHRNPLLHSFLVPFFVVFLLPADVLAKAFLAGYFSHVVADIGEDYAWVHIKRSSGRLCLVVSAVIILVLIFDIDLMVAVERVLYL